MSQLHDRIREISKKLNLAHLGSCLTAVDIIDNIYSVRKDDEPFILSCGHAGLALYVVIEKYYGINAEEIFAHHGTHPDRCDRCKLYCSTGSLGHGLPIAAGMALTDRKKNVYCLISDGECMEGNIWETANFIRKYRINNLKLYLNYNGWSAYGKIDEKMIGFIVWMFPQIDIVKTKVEDYGLEGLSAHYVRL